MNLACHIRIIQFTHEGSNCVESLFMMKGQLLIINEYCKTISICKLCVNIDSSQQYIHGDLGHFKNVSDTLYLLVTTIFTYYLKFCLKDIYIHDLLIYIYILVEIIARKNIHQNVHANVCTMVQLKYKIC